MADEQPAGSSPAAVAETPAPSERLSSLSLLDLQAWRETGTIPGTSSTDADADADSSPAAPAEQATSTEVTEPASEAGKPRKTADDRKRELAADIAADLAERAAIRADIARETARLAQLRPTQATDAPPAASSPAPVLFPSFDAYLALHPDTPYEEYLDQRADFRAEQKFKALEQQSQATQAQTEHARSLEQRDGQFRARISEAVKADPAFLDSLSPAVKALKPFDAIRDAQGRWTEQPTARHAIAEELLSSEVAPQLMRHFTDHPEDLDRLTALTPRDLLKALGKLEAAVSAGTPAAPAPKTVTDAPPPPTTLGTRPAEPADAAESAVRRRDQAAYNRAKNREDLARLGK